MRRILQGWLARLATDRTGSIFIETAIALSFLSTLIVGGIEAARYVLLAQKLERVVSTAADLASAGQTISTSDIDQIFAAGREIAQPFDLSANGTVIVSSVSASGGTPPRVDWQRAGAGNLSVGSAIGVAGGIANLPQGFTVRDGEEVIVAEVYYAFEPFIAPDIIGPSQLYRVSFFRPRFAPLTALVAN
jgi:Flp pilus assembly protein TadG